MLFYGRKRKEHFAKLIQKIDKKMAGWKSRMLSSGAKLVLIKHVLVRMPLHLIAAFDPPKSVERIESIFANFFLGFL